MERRKFIIREKYVAGIDTLPVRAKVEAMAAIALYGISRETMDFANPEAAMYFATVKPMLDLSWTRYICGKKGGAPKGNRNAAKKQPKNNQKTTKMRARYSAVSMAGCDSIDTCSGENMSRSEYIEAKKQPKSEETEKNKERSKETRKEDSALFSDITTAVEKEKKIKKEKETAYPFSEFWDLYDKKVGKKEKIKAKWDKLSERDRAAIFEYVPLYKAAQPDKRFRKNPETFLNNDGWKDEIIQSCRDSRKNRIGLDVNKYWE